MKDLTIAVSSIAGDPRSEKTWSGTPANLIKSFEELGVTVVAIDASLARPMRAFCRMAQLVMGFKGHTVRGPIARRLAARRSESECLRAGVKRILHLGTLDISEAGRKSRLERYIYFDYTWDLYFRHSHEPVFFSARAIQVSEMMEQRAFATAKGLFPIAHYIKDNLIAHYRVNPEDIIVVGTGRGKIAPFHGLKDYASGQILFTAKERFEEKGGALLLEGFRIASKKNPSLKLVLAGKAVEGTTMGSAHNITVAGRVSWEELQRLFEKAALFAMPAYSEPWGLVYLEALACKTPLLGMARNSLPELTKNGRFGFLVEEPDPKLVADAILKAFSDLKALERMGRDGQKHCLDGFSWQKAARLMRDRMLEESR